MDIKSQIGAIQERNRRVECDKAWETSWVRRITILIFTYIIASVWLVVIENDKPFLNALVPTIGYLLSTLSLPIVRRRLWEKSKKTSNEIR